MSKTMVQETVHNGGEYDGSSWPPEDPDGFMAWFQECIDRIPVEHRQSAKIEVSAEGVYGGHSPHIEITYMRPETDEQFTSRVQRETRRADARKREQDRRQTLCDVKVLEVAVAVMNRALDELVDACLGDDGKPKAPDRGALMRARAMLQPACKHTLQKSRAPGSGSG